MFSKSLIKAYLDARHMEDGGYFFARITPSSGLDTFLATELILNLGFKPPKTDILKFWRTEIKDGNVENLQSLFLISHSFQLLHNPQDELLPFKALLQKAESRELFKPRHFTRQNEKAAALSTDTTNPLYLDAIENEGKDLYYYTATSLLLNYPLDQKRVLNRIAALQNRDGGYGTIAGSDISTTFYILNMLQLLKLEPQKKISLKKYLQVSYRRAHYLEEYYWIGECLSLLKQSIPEPDSLVDYLGRCFTSKGGFNRSQHIGAPSIEYTHQAVHLIRLLEKQVGTLIV